MENIFHELIQYLKESTVWQSNLGWIAQVAAIITLTALTAFAASFVLKRLEKKLHKSENLWDDAFVSAIRRPVSGLLWVIGIGFAADIIHHVTETPIFSAIPEISNIVFIGIIGWALLRFVDHGTYALVEQKRRKNKRPDMTTVDAINNLLKVSIVITMLLIVMQAMGYSISAVLTFGGIGGIAIGFAAKDLLANFFGALMVYLDRPFNIGDWIRSPDRTIEGVVEKIGWRITTIRTFDKRPLYIPNSVFTQVAVENPSRMSHRRIYETIGIRYQDIGVMGQITEAVSSMLKQHDEIDESQTLIVNFDAFNHSSCDFFIYTFTHTTDWVEFHRIKQDVLLHIARIIDENDAEIAYPTKTLHMATMPEALTNALNTEGTPKNQENKN